MHHEYHQVNHLFRSHIYRYTQSRSQSPYIRRACVVRIKDSGIWTDTHTKQKQMVKRMRRCQPSLVMHPKHYIIILASRDDVMEVGNFCCASLDPTQTCQNCSIRYCFSLKALGYLLDNQSLSKHTAFNLFNFLLKRIFYISNRCLEIRNKRRP